MTDDFVARTTVTAIALFIFNTYRFPIHAAEEARFLIGYCLVIGVLATLITNGISWLYYKFRRSQ